LQQLKIDHKYASKDKADGASQSNVYLNSQVGVVSNGVSAMKPDTTKLHLDKRAFLLLVLTALALFAGAAACFFYSLNRSGMPRVPC